MRTPSFTLAEVLITLGIISVVAALTIPSVIGKYNERATISKYKKCTQHCLMRIILQ